MNSKITKIERFINTVLDSNEDVGMSFMLDNHEDFHIFVIVDKSKSQGCESKGNCMLKFAVSEEGLATSAVETMTYAGDLSGLQFFIDICTYVDEKIKDLLK